mmetsp:Transcript_2289/g.5025  ORF Transcript_2289/g.5025 Transcript_2289/m.5025 type:complete len:337 (-) Transcript_2289:412-1422(-)|eukprot:CAMPEP_0168774846 /NCGR_PEP_ID=MMETSP0725-20121227/5206_1 /TAXON_ID=265536 /ORGANISM="Amphiprora sp., Strain CCMP467" /LENGTH=336 /DNA_ID=CAMNT_0008824455 /DNA_START=124 /DNA_END=1134 /DNA_ORIENTATION=-
MHDHHQQEGRDPLLSARAEAASHQKKTHLPHEEEHHHHAYNTRFQEKWESEHSPEMRDDENYDMEETNVNKVTGAWKAVWSEEHKRDFYVDPVSNTVSWFAPSVSIPLNAEEDKELSPHYSPRYQQQKSVFPFSSQSPSSDAGKGRLLIFVTLVVLALSLQCWMNLYSEDEHESLSSPAVDPVPDPEPVTEEKLDAIGGEEDEEELLLLDDEEEEHHAENNAIEIDEYPSLLESAKIEAEVTQSLNRQTAVSPIDSEDESACQSNSLFEHHVVLPLQLTKSLAQHSHDKEHAQSILSRLELEMLIQQHPKGLCKLPMAHHLFPKKCKLSYLLHELE